MYDLELTIEKKTRERRGRNRKHGSDNQVSLDLQDARPPPQDTPSHVGSSSQGLKNEARRTAGQIIVPGGALRSLTICV